MSRSTVCLESKNSKKQKTMKTDVKAKSGLPVSDLSQFRDLSSFYDSAIRISMAGKIGETICTEGDLPGFTLLRSTQEKLSFHEAAHVVVMLLSGRSVFKVSLCPDSPYSDGYASCRADGAAPDETTPSDEESVRRFSERQVDEPPDLDRLRAETERMLLKNWSCVSAIAIALVEKGSLNRREIKALCGPARQSMK